MIKFCPTNPDNLRTTEWVPIDQICQIDKNQNLNKRMLSARLLVFVNGQLILQSLKTIPVMKVISTWPGLCWGEIFLKLESNRSSCVTKPIIDLFGNEGTDWLTDINILKNKCFSLWMSTIYLIRRLIDICMNLFMISELWHSAPSLREQKSLSWNLSSFISS